MILASVVLPAWMMIGGGRGVEWAGGEGCPSVEDLFASTSRFLGRELEDLPQRVAIDARVFGDPDTGQLLRLSLRVDGVREEHELWAEDCSDLVEDVAFLIATAIDPFVLWTARASPGQVSTPPIQYPRTRPRPQPAEPEPLEPEPLEPEPLEPLAIDEATEREGVDEAEGRPRRREAITGTLGAAGLGAVGLFPNVGGGVQLEGGIERAWLRWQLGAAGWFGGRYRTDAGAGADLLAVLGTTGLCGVPSVGKVDFALCGIAGGGVFRAVPINTTAAQPLLRPWVVLGADLRVMWTPRPGLGLFVGMSVLPALVRPSWSIVSPDSTSETPPVSGALRLGVELRWGRENRA